ncbi:MAG: phosphoribosyltransferase family protein [Planctomycetota bacterium]|nr:phosphoribosyltransferase family protein [Planctomycetota bacterium]
MRTMADAKRVQAIIDDLARAIGETIARAPAGSRWALVGVRSRGDVLATRVREKLSAGGFDARPGVRIEPSVGLLDITLYRDDLSEIGTRAVVRTTEIPFDIGGANVVLLDDVLMSGRSVRAALQELMDLGRPKRVWLAVLVDRGGRELPIAPDFVGLSLSNGAANGSANGTANGAQVEPGDTVDVRLSPTDAVDAIEVRPGSATRGSKP